MSDRHEALVVVAAGSSARFGTDKLAVRLGGASVLEHALAAVRRGLERAPCALVVRPDEDEASRRRWEHEGVRVVSGGARRQDSVRAGVEAFALADDAIVAIHDGARPFVPARDVRAVIDAASAYGAALLVAPIVDTVKRVNGGGNVVETVPRERLVRALTPQAFRVSVLRAAWRRAGDEEWTDEAALVEAQGGKVCAVEGDPRNVKITRPEDVAMLEGLFRRSARVGQGVDVHPFAPGRPLWLCGVELPGEVGLDGHSDADAALHAITDAILGACGAGDIGEHFPSSDERWRNARSDVFVLRAIELATAGGWRIVHCDVTLLAEQPRISPHRARMRARLAELLGVRDDEVNLKATTCEGMGFVGRREGLVALATVTLEQR